jgi:chromosome segregation ATPase
MANITASGDGSTALVGVNPAFVDGDSALVGDSFPPAEVSEQGVLTAMGLALAASGVAALTAATAPVVAPLAIGSGLAMIVYAQNEMSASDYVVQATAANSIAALSLNTGVSVLPDVQASVAQCVAPSESFNALVHVGNAGVQVCQAVVQQSTTTDVDPLTLLFLVFIVKFLDGPLMKFLNWLLDQLKFVRRTNLPESKDADKKAGQEFGIVRFDSVQTVQKQVDFVQNTVDNVDNLFRNNAFDVPDELVRSWQLGMVGLDQGTTLARDFRAFVGGTRNEQVDEWFANVTQPMWDKLYRQRSLLGGGESHISTAETSGIKDLDDCCDQIEKAKSLLEGVVKNVDDLDIIYITKAAKSILDNCTSDLTNCKERVSVLESALEETQREREEVLEVSTRQNETLREENDRLKAELEQSKKDEAECQENEEALSEKIAELEKIQHEEPEIGTFDAEKRKLTRELNKVKRQRDSLKNLLDQAEMREARKEKAEAKVLRESDSSPLTTRTGKATRQDADIQWLQARIKDLENASSDRTVIRKNEKTGLDQERELKGLIPMLILDCNKAEIDEFGRFDKSFNNLLLSTKLDSLKKDELRALASLFDAVQARVDHIGKSNTNAVELVDKFNTTKAVLLGQIIPLEQRCGKLKELTQLQETEDKILREGLPEDCIPIEVHEQMIKRLREKLIAQEEAFELAITKVENEADEAEDELETSNQQLLEQVIAKRDCEAKLEKAQAGLAEVTAAVADLEFQLGEATRKAEEATKSAEGAAGSAADTAAAGASQAEIDAALARAARAEQKASDCYERVEALEAKLLSAKNDFERQRSEVAAAEGKFGLVMSQLKSLQEKIDSLNADLEARKAELSTARAEADRFRTAADEAAEAAAAAEDAGAPAEAEAAVEAAEAAAARAEAAEVDCREQEAEIKRLRAALKKMENTLNDQTEIAEQETTLRLTCIRNQRQVESVNAQLQERIAELGSIEKRRDELEAELEEARARVEAEQRRVTQSAAELAETQEELQRVSAELEAARAREADATAAAASAVASGDKAEAAAAEEECRCADEECEELVARLAELDTELKENETERLEIKNELLEAMNKQKELENEIDGQKRELRSATASCTEEIKRIESLVAQLRNENEGLVNEINSATALCAEDIRKLQAKFEAKDLEIAELKSQLILLQEELQTAEINHAKLAEANVTLVKNNNKLLNDLKECKDEIAKLKAMIQPIQIELAQCTENLRREKQLKIQQDAFYEQELLAAIEAEQGAYERGVREGERQTISDLSRAGVIVPDPDDPEPHSSAESDGGCAPCNDPYASCD